MRVLLSSLVLLLLVPASGFSQSSSPSRAGDVVAAADYEAALTDLLRQAVTKEGWVRYDLLRGPLNEDFRRVLKAVETFDVASLGSHEARLAFWMNAYNVQMLQHIVETPGIDDIMAGGHAARFFRTPYRTAGMDLSLDQIEHVILRGQPGPPALTPLQVGSLDPRIHAGLNCAARSCPRLRARAFTEADVDAELDAAMRDFVNSPRHFRMEGTRLMASALLDWYGDDFDLPGHPAGDALLAFLAPGRPNAGAVRTRLAGRTAAQLRADEAISFFYDWSVNRAEK